MAFTAYANLNPYDIVVPTPNGSGVTIGPGEAVAGSYIGIYKVAEQLTEVQVPPFDETKVVYYYPEVPLIGGGTITSVTAGTSLTGGGTGPNVTLSVANGGITNTQLALSAVAAGNIASGQVVKTLNGLTDVVSILAGTYTSISVNANQITVDNTAPGLTSAIGNLPLSLVLSNNNQTLTASIAITPLNDGGAVALQIPSLPAQPNVVFSHTMQLGTAAVSNVFTDGVLGVNVTPTDIAAINRPAATYFKPLIGTDDLFIGVDSINDVVSVLTDLGEFFTKQTVTEGDTVSTSFTLQENPWENVTLVKGHFTSVAANAADNFLNLPFDYYNTLTLKQVATDIVHPALVGTGKIVGTSTLAPLIDLNIGTAPAIRLGFGTAVPSASALEVFGTDQMNPSIRLSTDGEIMAKTLLVENVYVNAIFVDQPSTVPIEVIGGPQTVVADASAGQVIVQLPVIPGGFTKSLLLTVKKADISANPVSIVVGSGSLMEGTTDPINLTRGWSAVTLVSVGLNWYKVSEL